jgi:hypothetical protein
MKRKDLDPKNADNYLESVRFFSFLPKDVSRTLSTQQKRVIALTILDLQRKNPRILREIYLEQPDESNKRPTVFKRIKRRFLLFLRGIFYEMVIQKSERRFGASIADYIFLLAVFGVLLLFAITVIFILYGLKSLIGIDLVPGVHFFYVD